MSEPNGVEPGPETDSEVGLEGDSEVDLETPDADAVEQHTPVREEVDPIWPDRIPFDADEADVADQSRIVEIDDDDYR
jgi:hypothetical protein